jgi:hypothetical protein
MADAKAPRRRTLIVANRTAATPLLLQEVDRRAGEAPTSFVLLVPEAGSRSNADWTVNEAVRSLRQAAQGPTGHRPAHVEGRVGTQNDDPFDAIKAALADEHFDDVLISTLPKRTSKWLRRDLPARVQQLGIPVAVITPPKARRITFEESGIWGGGQL